MSFLFPSFLFALGAVAIPVIIHLFDLQRPKKVFFTNVQLLKNVNEETSSSRKLRNLLVLLCRILTIIFLVLAFAQPFMKGKNNQMVVGSQSIGIYIDNSLSMQNEDGQKSLLDLGVKTAEKIPDLFPSASRFFFLDNTFSPQDKLPLSSDKFKDRITEVKYTNTFRNLENVYKRQTGTLFYSGNAQSRKLFWFSDFQKSTIGDLNKIGLDTNVQIFLVPLQNQKVSNVYVDSLWLENLFVKANENNTLKVKLANSGDREIGNLHLKLIIDDIQSGSASVEMAPNGTAVASFDFNIKDNKVKYCKIQFEDNPITFDNEYYFVIQVSPTINILAISDQKTPFIRNVYTNEEIFNLSENKFGNISVSDVGRANLIVVEGYDRLNGAEQAMIKSFYEKGGHLLLFPSEKPDFNSLQTFSASFKLPLPQLVSAVPGEQAEVHMLQFPDIKNPFFENVFEKTDKNVDMPFANPVIRWGNSGQKILNTKKDESFIALFQTYKSRIYLASAPLNEPFTNFQRHAIFVPVMYKIAIGSITENKRLAYTFNDKNILVPVGEVKGDKKFSLKKGDFTYIPEQSLKQGKLIFDIPNVAMDPGFYQLTIEDSVKRVIAVNIGKNESVMDFYTKEDLSKSLGKYANVSIFENEINETFVNDFKEKYIGLSLWKYCLLIALLFMMFEVLIIRFWK